LPAGQKLSCVKETLMSTNRLKVLLTYIIINQYNRANKTCCLLSVMINSLYLFQALICSSPGGNVYTTICIFCVYYVRRLLAGLGWSSSRHNTHKIYQVLYIQCHLMMSK
jgi:hypothetical protein